MPTSRTFLTAAGLLLGLALPATASADTFCVALAATCAAGNDRPSIEAAVAAAQTTPVDDVIEVGSGSFTSESPDGFSFGGNGHAIVIRGRGRDATTLTAPAAIAKNRYVVFADASATIEALSVRIPGNGNDAIYGINSIGGTTSDVRIVASATAAYRYGLNQQGGSAHDVDVDLSASATTSGIAITADDAWIHDAVVDTKGTGIVAKGASSVDGAQVRARVGGWLIGTSTIRNAAIRLDGSSPIGIRVFNQPGAPTAATLADVTVDGGDGGAAVGVEAEDPFSGDAAVAISGLVTARVKVPLRAKHSAGTGAAISVARSCFGAGNVVTAGALITLGAGNISPCDPGLRNVAAGDLRPRADSVLRDAGDPAAPPAPALDALGAARVVDGDGDGIARRDIGAIEFASTTPSVAVLAPPSTRIHQVRNFRAMASDADLGEAFTITWTFDDGGTATGELVAHAFATTGVHTATATVRDRSGATSSTTVKVDVLPAPDRTAPVISKLSVTGRFRSGTRPPARLATASRRGGMLRLTIDETAKLTLGLERRVGRRWRPQRGTATVIARRGANSIRFDGTLMQGRRSKPGRYRLSIRGTDAAGNTSAPRRLRFTVMAGR